MFGKPGATKEEIRNAAIKANAHDFIMHLGNGYQPEIGEGGVVSGAASGRESRSPGPFSKMHLFSYWMKPPLPWTRGLRSLCRRPFSGLLWGVTTHMSFHDTHGGKDFSIFHHGEIVETGIHNELLNREGGYYQRLFNAQYGSHAVSVVSQRL